MRDQVRCGYCGVVMGRYHFSGCPNSPSAFHWDPIEGRLVGERIHRMSNVYCRSIDLGEDTRIAAFVEVQAGAKIGARCKISSHSFICAGVTIEDDVFIGHGVMFTNDVRPKTEGEWELVPTMVHRGVAVGTGAIILPGVEIGEGALVGAGTLVMRSVPAGATVVSDIGMRILP
jgi:acetyltransferase-like isoleucine patch superfamily enzyme